MQLYTVLRNSVHFPKPEYCEGGGGGGVILHSGVHGISTMGMSTHCSEWIQIINFHY